MKPEDRDALSSVSRLNCQDQACIEQLHTYFGKNFEVVNFWLNTHVFPSDCMQYPYRLVASAWHLATANEIHGFSGTNDGKLTLPWKVLQQQLPELMSTNGKLVQVLTDPQLGNTTYHPIPHELAINTTGLLRDILAHKENISVLLDAGAVITDMSNRQVCETVLASTADRFRGAVFFDESGHLRVLNKHGREWPLACSPIKVSDCFTYLDDIHTRGTDLKFPPNAVAVQTLGRNMQKDTLVQAAMRMRQLGRGQRVLFWGTPEVTNAIRTVADIYGLENDCSLDSRCVLLWALTNTVTNLENALIQWAVQGSVFCRQRTAVTLVQEGSPRMEIYRELVADTEVLELAEMYERPLERLRADVIVRRKLEMMFQGLTQNLEPELTRWDETASKMIEFLRTRATQYLKGHYCIRSALDEEYERELEKVEEEEREVDCPPRCKPDQQSEWAWHAVTESGFVRSCQEAMDSGIYPQLVSLKDDFDRTLKVSSAQTGMELRLIPGILATKNFLRTVNHHEEVDDFLRPVEFVLSHSDDSGYTFVALSGWEAEHVFSVLRKSRQTTARMHELMDPFGDSCFPPMQQGEAPLAYQLAFLQLQLLSGCCNFRCDGAGRLLGHLLGMMQPGLLTHLSKNAAEATELCDHLCGAGFLGRNGFLLQVPKINQVLDGAKDATWSPDAVVECMKMINKTKVFNQDPYWFLQDLVCIRGRMSQFPHSDLDKMLKGAGEA